ncbi:MAG TPA: oligosaccharide flippase family protein, partial [Gemmatimonadaceae bacterium]|nr:oligosaccharide flippase family protein [Gemmatimonadaceae bacterium]
LSRALTHAVALRLGREEDGADLPEVVWTSMAMMFVLGVVGGLVLAALARWVVGHGLNVPPELVDESRKTLYLLALSMPLIVTTAGFRGLLEAHQHFGASVALRVPLGVFSFVGPLLVLPFSRALPPIVALLVVGRALTFVAHLIVCLRRYPFLRERLALRASAVMPLLRIGGWMTTTNVISPLMNYLDRFFVGAILPMAAVAHYVTPYELVSKLSLFPQSLMGVFFPAFASSFVSDRERTAALFGRSLRGLLLFMFPLALVLVLFAREGLTLWVGAAFAAASAPVLRWLAVGIFINAMAHAPFNVLQGIGRPDLTGKLHLAELPFYLAALYLLAHAFGIVGVAIAWVLRISADAIALMALTSRRVPSVTPEVRTVGMWTMLALALFAAAVVIEGPVAKLVFFVVVLAGYAVASWTRIVHPVERRTLLRVIGVRSGEPVPPL